MIKVHAIIDNPHDTVKIIEPRKNPHLYRQDGRLINYYFMIT
jgi:hypothetical protein